MMCSFELLQSLNPLPPERLAMRESSERERSSEPIPEDSTESETGASFNGDVEDNLEETSKFFADSYRPGNIKPLVLVKTLC